MSLSDVVRYLFLPQNQFSPIQNYRIFLDICEQKVLTRCARRFAVDVKYKGSDGGYTEYVELASADFMVKLTRFTDTN